MTTQTTPVTVIGLGLMGQALARVLLNEGHATTIWNRSARKADALVAQGARRAATATEAVAASPLVLICVSDYAAVRETLDPARDALTGKVLVNLTSGSPAQARETAAWAARLGATYIDGAIMAVPQMMGQPGTRVLYSGSPEAFRTYESTLLALGGASAHVGDDPGAAALYDLALLTMMYTLYGGFLHALALVGTAKIDGVTFMKLGLPWLGDVASWLPGFAKDIDTRTYATDVSALAINQAAVTLIIEASKAEGLRGDALTHMQALLDRRVAQGHAADGLPSLIELVRKPEAAASAATA
jgi:3-hydroxyisobutyrate dehydrogenase-like beta-hydroxyacid dehydrogenase